MPTEAPPANFVPIDRGTFRRNPDAGATSKVVPGLRSYRVAERLPGSATDWRSIGSVVDSVDGDVRTVAGQFRLLEWSGRNLPPSRADDVVDRTFRSDTPGVRITPHQDYQRFEWAIPSPPFLFKYVDAVVTCPKGHAHKLSELDDYEDDDVYKTNLCPTCGEAVEGIEWEKPADVARVLGV